MTDFLLKNLINAANEVDFSFGISLILPGGIVTGEVISAEKYLAAYANQFAKAWPNGDSEQTRESFFMLGVGGQQGQDNDDYIHLKDAAYVSTDGFLPKDGKGMLWRGKIESVSGYSFGRFQAS